MRITFLDAGFLDISKEILEENKNIGELTIYDRLEKDIEDIEEKIIERIGDSEIITTSSIKITRNIMKKCRKLKYICTQSAGYDVIDIEAAREFGIIVSNVPGCSTNAVAQMAIALMLEACNHVGEHNRAVRKDKWNTAKDWCFWEYDIIGTNSKKAGIIGYGKIGRCTGKVLNSLGMDVLAFTINEDDKTEDYVSYVDVETIYKECDFIFLHCPHNTHTEYIINKNSIDKMKDGVILINNSRGKLVKNDDLYESLRVGKIKVAACDVVEDEPIGVGHKLLELDNFIVTPHISWGTVEVKKQIIYKVFENINSYINGKPINVVS